MEKTEVLTILCRNTSPYVKPIAPRHLDGQLKSAWRGPIVRFFQLMKLCDDLEQSVQQNQTYAQQLLQVALKEALEPK